MPRTHKTVKDKLDEALNLTNTELEKAEKPLVEVLAPSNRQLEKVSRPEDFSPECQEDYEYARATYYTLVEKGQEAINGSLELAQQAESPRAYEVVAIAIKAVADVATALINLQEKMKNLRGLKPTQNADEIQQKPVQGGDTYVFAGTSDDVLRIITEGKKK